MQQVGPIQKALQKLPLAHWAILTTALAGRDPIFVHEPWLEKSTIRWWQDLLPRVYLASDVWEALQRANAKKESA